MDKLKLSLEQLAVESFASEEPAAEKRGTVRGQESNPQTCGEYVCYAGTEEPQDTCYMDCTMLCSMGTCTQIFTVDPC
jgi:hypothetical protein